MLLSLPCTLFTLLCSFKCVVFWIASFVVRKCSQLVFIILPPSVLKTTNRFAHDICNTKCLPLLGPVASSNLHAQYYVANCALGIANIMRNEFLGIESMIWSVMTLWCIASTWNFSKILMQLFIWCNCRSYRQYSSPLSLSYLQYLYFGRQINTNTLCFTRSLLQHQPVWSTTTPNLTGTRRRKLNEPFTWKHASGKLFTSFTF